jgi:uncharacterized protein YxjI
MLDKTKFVVKQQTKFLMAKSAYDIVDGDSGNALGTATEKRGLLATLFGMVLGKERMPLTIEVRQKPDDALVFSIRRSGLLFKKVRLLNAQGQAVGTYKAKKFSLTGGFHIYDEAGKHIAEIKGKWFKAEYTLLTPDGKEMGSVSKKWGGMAKELFSSAGTFGVQIAPRCAEDTKAKMLILGAAIAIDAVFQQKGGKSGGGGGDEGGGGDADD